jgi:hypothetical protein
LLDSNRAAAQATPASAGELPGTIVVHVTDTSLNPLRAQVSLPAFGVDVQLPPEGLAFFVDVPDGLYVVRVRLEGYTSESRALRVTGDTARVDFVLSPVQTEPAKPEPVRARGVAQARLRYFIERGLTTESGAFITRTAIERDGARTPGGVLRGVPDVIVERGARRRTIVRSRHAAGPGCAAGMVVFVDGAPLRGSDDVSAVAVTERSSRAEYAQLANWRPSREPARDAAMPELRWVGPHGGDLVKVAHNAVAGSSTSTARRRHVSDVDEVRLSSVVAIEVYSSPASVPPEIQMPGAECGVVLVWTAGA